MIVNNPPSEPTFHVLYFAIVSHNDKKVTALGTYSNNKRSPHSVLLAIITKNMRFVTLLSGKFVLKFGNYPPKSSIQQLD